MILEILSNKALDNAPLSFSLPALASEIHILVLVAHPWNIPSPCSLPVGATVHPTLQTPYQVLRWPWEWALGLLGVPLIANTAVSASSTPLETTQQSSTVWNIWHQHYPWNELELQHHSPTTAYQRQYDWSLRIFSQRDACHPLKFAIRHGQMIECSSQLLFNVIYVEIAPEG